MEREDVYCLVAVVVFGLSMITGVIGSAMLMSNKQCIASWKDSGHGVQWSIMGGCRVQLKSGHYVPEDSLKAIQEDK